MVGEISPDGQPFCLSLRDAREQHTCRAHGGKSLHGDGMRERRSTVTASDTLCAHRIVDCQRASGGPTSFFGFIIGRLRLSPPLQKALVPGKGQSVVGLLLGQGTLRFMTGMSWKMEMRSLNVFSMILKSLTSYAKLRKPLAWEMDGLMQREIRRFKQTRPTPPC